jgi:GMP synthase-like glutamine amidotransferase
MSIQDPPHSLHAPRHARLRRGQTADLAADGGAGAIAAVIHGESDAPLGLLADVLATGPFAPQIIRVTGGQTLPNVRTVSVAVWLGALEHTTDPQPPWTAGEIDWLRRAHDAGTGLLGIGSGAHALAVALGGATEPAHRGRHGWLQVASTEPGLIAAGPWFAWSDRTIVLPPGAELLAHADGGPQAFRVGRHLGVQFHPEVTPELIGGFLREHHGSGIDTQGVIEAAVRDFRQTAGNAYRLLSGFLDSVSPALTR